MSEFFGSIWWLIVSLGVLVTFHEYGHYWVARRCGVKVLRFSVGFGRPLWSRRGRDGTEYVVAALPLGGYVKMLDEREGEVSPQERPQSFNAKPVAQRFAIVAAGPLANLLLCVGLLWLMFVVGKPDYLAQVGRTSGIAAEAGIRPGDALVRIGDRDVTTWTEAGIALANALVEREPATVTVRDASGELRQRVLPLDRPGLVLNEQRPITELGFYPAQWLLPAVVGQIAAGSPAENRLRSGDRLLAINDEAIDGFDAIGHLVQKLGREATALRVRIEREGRPQTLDIVPTRHTQDGQTRWIRGIGPAPLDRPYDAVRRYGPAEALAVALGETAQMAGDTVRMLWRMVSGGASLENISGPITIAQAANSSAGLGLAWFLYFLALLSLSLCIMNLLPIPVLDGGHLLYYLIELILGRPVREQVLEAGQYIGLVLLAGLMGLAFYNDIIRLVS